MATAIANGRPALMIFCAYAQRSEIHASNALAMFRHAGGTIADSVFYEYWRVAAKMPKAFGMDGIEYAAQVAADERE